METPRCDDPSNILLPWYLNGTLKAAEEEQVRSHLTSCSVCSRELAELSEVTGPLAARAPGKDAPRPTLHSRRLRWAVAATAIAGILLAAYWVRARQAASPSTEEERVVLLDLHSGSMRNGNSAPALGLAGEVGKVDLRLAAPVNSGATYEMELRSPEGKVLTSTRKAPLQLDALGRTTFRIQADLLSRGGDYHLVLREFDVSGTVHEYPYVFRVVSQP